MNHIFKEAKWPYKWKQRNISGDKVVRWYLEMGNVITTHTSSRLTLFALRVWCNWISLLLSIDVVTFPLTCVFHQIGEIIWCFQSSQQCEVYSSIYRDEECSPWNFHDNATPKPLPGYDFGISLSTPYPNSPQPNAAKLCCHSSWATLLLIKWPSSADNCTKSFQEDVWPGTLLELWAGLRGDLVGIP